MHDIANHRKDPQSNRKSDQHRMNGMILHTCRARHDFSFPASLQSTHGTSDFPGVVNDTLTFDILVALSVEKVCKADHESRCAGRRHIISKCFSILDERLSAFRFRNQHIYPAARASLDRKASVKVVNITSGVAGNSRLSTRAASIPFMTGMMRSITMTLGWSWRALSILGDRFRPLRIRSI